MSQFNYEWWTVDITFPTGRITCLYNGKSKAHVVRQIKREQAVADSDKNLSLPIWMQSQRLLEIHWETMKLDHIGYQRMS